MFKGEPYSGESETGANKKGHYFQKKTIINVEHKKIVSLNLCLGLKNKRDIVKKLMMDNDIEILCLQETEIPVNFPTNLLTFKGFSYENEVNI